MTILFWCYVETLAAPSVRSELSASGVQEREEALLKLERIATRVLKSPDLAAWAGPTLYGHDLGQRIHDAAVGELSAKGDPMELMAWNERVVEQHGQEWSLLGSCGGYSD